jgi:hypothetical protein
MADDAGQDAPLTRTGRRRIGPWLGLVLLVVLVAMLAAAWLSRQRIASEVIEDVLAERGIEARYEIVSIGPREAVLRNIEVGDPARPDLTVEQARVRILHRFGFPKVEEVRLVRPRLQGSYRNGVLSFGALDPLIFSGEPQQPFELPDLSLAIEDGRALLDSDFGRVGLSFTGSGWLRGGFAGELAAMAPDVAAGGCAGTGATLYGTVSIANAQPNFTGPLRLARLACPDARLTLADASLQLDLQGDRRLEGVEGTGALALGATELAEAELAGIAGDLDFTFRGGDLTARYELEGRGVSTPQARLARLELDGSLRARRHFERLELDAQLRGSDLRFGNALDARLANAIAATQGTLLQPLLRQVRGQVARQAPGSTITADLIARRTGERLSLAVPQARLRARSGEALLALSRFQLAWGGQAALRYSGNWVTGGGLPRIAARMEQRDGGIELSASMAPYRAGDSVLAVPRLALLHASDGTMRFTGDLRASGPLPGGAAQGLELPLSGSWSPAGGLVLWRDCAAVRFQSLRYANLTLGSQRLTLCPPTGAPIVRYGPRGLQVAAGVPSLRLAGTLGETPIALDSGAVGFAWPGVLTANRLNVALGPVATATRFAVTDLTARIGSEIGGTFAGTDVLLFAVPLDVREASGSWRYTGGRLQLTEGTFRLTDRRQEAPRYEPLVARDATLALEHNLITADALLREPTSDREVTRVAIRHDLTTGTGSADLAIEGLLFDRALQPVALTPLALGIVANVDGVVTGSGRIDWNAEQLTSTGRFSSTDLDFAAAFGPVAGASGTVEFTDLLGLTTAPGQVLQVQSVNPGFEVNDGEVRFQLRNGEVLALEGASWPFLGGSLTMRPLDITFGVQEVRAYIFEIVGLEAALFLQRIELDNLSASGTFDGTIPVVFDRAGNGSLHGGELLSRSPGGNVSYVGELTYRDLSPMANYAFAMLRSLDYRQMRIQLDGALAGEIVTRVRIDGVRQGEGATSNIITRRLARLPIRFDVNVRAPFLTLIGSVRGLYDPDAIRDPRELGLLDAQGNPIRSAVDGEEVPVDPSAEATKMLEELIQPSDSEERP